MITVRYTLLKISGGKRKSSAHLIVHRGSGPTFELDIRLNKKSLHSSIIILNQYSFLAGDHALPKDKLVRIPFGKFNSFGLREISIGFCHDK